MSAGASSYKDIYHGSAKVSLETPFLLLPLEIILHYFLAPTCGFRKTDIQALLVATGLRYYYTLHLFSQVNSSLSFSARSSYYFSSWRSNLAVVRKHPEMKDMFPLAIPSFSVIMPSKTREKFQRCIVCNALPIRKRSTKSWVKLHCGCHMHKQCATTAIGTYWKTLYLPDPEHAKICPYYEPFNIYKHTSVKIR